MNARAILARLVRPLLRRVGALVAIRGEAFEIDFGTYRVERVDQRGRDLLETAGSYCEAYQHAIREAIRAQDSGRRVVETVYGWEWFLPEPDSCIVITWCPPAHHSIRVEEVPA